MLVWSPTIEWKGLYGGYHRENKVPLNLCWSFWLGLDPWTINSAEVLAGMYRRAGGVASIKTRALIDFE
jgi:hypothetical protein